MRISFNTCALSRFVPGHRLLVVASTLVLFASFGAPASVHAHGITGWIIAIFMLPFVLIAAGLTGLLKRGFLRLILGPGARVPIKILIGIAILEVIVMQAPWILEKYVRRIDLIRHSFDTILGALVITAIINAVITLAPHLLLMTQSTDRRNRKVPWGLIIPAVLVFGVLTPGIFFGVLYLWKG